MKKRSMVTQQTILEALRPIMDPEIGMSVVDLGMISELNIENGSVEIKMVLTTFFCPLAGFIADRVGETVVALPGVKLVKVSLLAQRWDPSWIKLVARDALAERVMEKA
jgi:ATP-binding protein involved in chromosome partitioning